ncbi:PorV/PorQ family protein [Candidatus Poribacteria bacterium]|nr:PorV/PorQ family protein [Candidatus Poribacteria bacterium]
MQNRICFILFILIWFVNPTICFAGKYAGDFLSIGAGARALALGGAAIALTDDATGTYWNPASLIAVNKRSMVLMHAERFSGLETYNFFSLVSEIKPLGHLGVSWIRLSIDDIPIHEALSGTPEDRFGNLDLQPKGGGEYEEPLGYLQDVENALFFSYSRLAAEKPILIGKIPVIVSWGANLKYIFTHLGSANSRAIGFDLAALFSATFKSGRLFIGTVAQNAFAAEVKWNSKAVHEVPTPNPSREGTVERSEHEDIIPVNLRFGFAYTPAKGIFSHFTVVYALETQYGFTNHVGLEYHLMNFLTLRAGLHQREYAMGAGLKIKTYALDYAFTNEDLANSHQVSLNIMF